VKWRLRRPAGGRLPSLGQDFGAAHRAYVSRLGANAQLWLRTKPFSVPPGHELRECLHTFAHIVDQLDLGLRAQVLDVGCGPGWLSEFLARCGYWVTGVDVSEDMIEIARKRLASVSEPIGEGLEVAAEFHALLVRELPWRERFDAAILYDAMHHFDDEVETLRVIQRALVPGGRIYIHEGVRPEPGSAGEQILVAEMDEYGTLEAPFDPEYLEGVLRKAGFAEVTRFAAVDTLVDLSATEEELRRVTTLVERPPMNTVVAFNGGPLGEPDFAARISPKGSWQLAGQELSLQIEVENVGRCFWPAELGSSLPHGVVLVGPYLTPEDGARIELSRSRLPHPLSRGESAQVELRVGRAAVQNARELTVDLVREGLAWFEDYGSKPVTIPLPDSR
jgi:SAM-dependent methyltransferase